MSLVALAIRLATIRALKGRTLAGERVHDSRFAPIDIIATDETTPFIVVTTDDEESRIEGKDLLAGNRELELVIEVAAATNITVEGGDPPAVLTIPETDAGLEATLNLIGWQISRALAADGGEWGDLWRSIVTSIRSVKSRRGADDTKGVRYAARQIIIKLDHIAEPLPGAAPETGTGWARILEALKGDPEFAAIGQIVEAEIMSPAMLPWKRVRAALGLANDASGWISERPLVDEDDPAPVNIEIAQTDGFEFDATRAEEIDGPEPGP